MRLGYRMLNVLLCAGALATAPVISGCFAHHHEDHPWADNEEPRYERWERDTHRDHRDYNQRSQDEQHEYWQWRQQNSDR